MNIVLCVVCAVLMIFGITELVRVVVFWWSKPDTGKNFSIVVTPQGAEDCEAAVRAAAERMRWLDLRGPCHLICVNKEGDPEVESICRFLAVRYPYLKVSKKEDLVYHIVDEE